MVAIAAISLLVGGIGIMNIMLAGILERTHEIGVRRAVGARQSDISRQFLVEALLISFVGGVTGIFFGIGISRLIAWLAGWSTIVTHHLHPARFPGFGGSGPGVWNLSGHESRPARSGRSAAVRVSTKSH
jgi:predicted lysophospholipase L1 biosynthesis ABC-type transport system permease subunit